MQLCRWNPAKGEDGGGMTGKGPGIGAECTALCPGVGHRGMMGYCQYIPPAPI